MPTEDIPIKQGLKWIPIHFSSVRLFVLLLIFDFLKLLKLFCSSLVCLVCVMIVVCLNNILTHFDSSNVLLMLNGEMNQQGGSLSGMFTIH